MDRQRVVELFSEVTTWRRRGERAPHKPLLLLLALARVGRPDGRWLAFREVDRPMRRLLAEFGPSRQSYHPEYPYGRLRNDGLWEFDADYDLRLRESNSDPKKSDLVAQDVSAGFPDPIYEQLRSDRGLVRDVALRLLHGHFPETMHEDILQAVGLELDPTETSAGRPPRDPRFREQVLGAYERACAVCGFDVMLEDTTVGLDAAHIKWHQAGGPAEVSNGLCLCVLHHKLFDRGVFTLDDRRRVIVSERSRGHRGFREWLMVHHGEAVREPVRGEYGPAPGFLEWHRRWVFREPGRQVE